VPWNFRLRRDLRYAPGITCLQCWQCVTTIGQVLIRTNCECGLHVQRILLRILASHPMYHFSFVASSLQQRLIVCCTDVFGRIGGFNFAWAWCDPPLLLAFVKCDTWLLCDLKSSSDDIVDTKCLPEGVDLAPCRTSGRAAGLGAAGVDWTSCDV
jgi:hypothetical protein